MPIHIYSRERANGVSVIIDNFIEVSRKRGLPCDKISSLKEAGCSDLIIPYGIKNSIELLSSHFPLKIALLVDAISLGCLNKIRFYFRHRYFFQYDFFYCIYAYFRYSRSEKKILRKYDTVVVVSNTDAEYLKTIEREANSRIICVQNGAYFGSILPHAFNNTFTLGLLSSWGAKQTYHENAWFIETIYKKYIKNNPDICLLLAGRGNYIHRFDNYKNIVVLGEIDDLDLFFSQLDAFIAVNPKGCGILNRVLDALAHKVPIIGIAPSFSGFPESKNLYYSFNSYNSFYTVINSIKNNPAIASRTASKGFDYVLKNHNWGNNYNNFINQISSILELYV